MVASSLMELVLRDDVTSARVRNVAGQFVQSALTDLAQLEKLEESLAPEDPAIFDRRTAALLRAEYERWSGGAELLVPQLQALQHKGVPVADLDFLVHSLERTRSRLSITHDLETGLNVATEHDALSAGMLRQDIEYLLAEVERTSPDSNRPKLVGVAAHYADAVAEKLGEQGIHS